MRSENAYRVQGAEMAYKEKSGKIASASSTSRIRVLNRIQARWLDINKLLAVILEKVFLEL